MLVRTYVSDPATKHIAYLDMFIDVAFFNNDLC